MIILLSEFPYQPNIKTNISTRVYTFCEFINNVLRNCDITKIQLFNNNHCYLIIFDANNIEYWISNKTDIMYI